MSKLFSHAGVSRLHGKFKVRWANGAERVKVLIKGGHTDIDLIELMTPMTKEAAVLALIAMDFDNGNTEVRACLEAEAVKRGVLEKIKAEAEAMEDTRELEAEILEEILAEVDNVIDITEEVVNTPRASNGRFVKKSAMTEWTEAADAEEAKIAVA